MGFLGILAGVLTPSPLGLIRGAVARQPSRYAGAMPRQVAFSERVGLQPSLSGRTGSEEWDDQQAAGARSEGFALAAVTTPGGRSRVPWPVGMFRPNLPADLIEGRGTGYNTGAYPKGWIAVSQAGRPAWGASAGLAASRPNVQRATLLEPTEETPRAKAIAAAYAENHAGHDRLPDLFGD